MGLFMQIIGANSSNSGSTVKSEHIVDVKTQDFMTEVIEASMVQLVLVDFWAPWCGPCTQLTPVLEKIVKDADGKVKLAKMNIDTDPEVAGQLGVQSVPAVFAFKDGQPVDGFMGVQPEGQIKAFIEKHAGDLGIPDIGPMLEEADALLVDGKHEEALSAYFEIIQIDEDSAAAMAGMVKCNIAGGDIEAAEELLEAMNDEMLKTAEVKSAEAALQVAKKADEVGELGPLLAKIEDNAADHEARFALAEGLAAKGDKDAAVDHLIHIIKTDREWQDDGARAKLLEFFNAWGFKDPAAVSGRKKLSAVLFS